MKRKVIRGFRPLLGVSLLLVLAGCSTTTGTATGADGSEAPATAVSTSDSAATTDQQVAANKKAAQDFYDLAFNQKKLEEAAQKYLAADYLQHNPGVADGAAGFTAGIGALLKANPQLKATTHRVIGQADLVGLQTEMTAKPGGSSQSVMDIFRFDGQGKIVEHWDAIQDVPAKSANGHTMFDGPTEVAPVTASVLQKNTETVRSFLDLAFNQAKAQQAVDNFVGEQYLQHNPLIADGKEAFVKAFAGASPLTGAAATKFPRTIAEGDFVMAQTFAPAESGAGGSGSIDIFRLDADGKIVEHWDAVQDYPAKTVSGHTVWDSGK
ncbi:nuclear transport factor 2 family protein [Psychromicrobium lacuslunae]|uniref:nuclear transport factor 2 family protein n=1 Tax=Psychromicrobium lacuslunae TaxID=1618207 RepID=UPI0006961CEE|nr:nuclear transport factor 2 family protein [Psychromicrobium lacuslunae]